MTRVLIIIGLGVLLGVGGVVYDLYLARPSVRGVPSGAAVSATPEITAQPAPDFTVSDMTGKSHTLSGFRGRWVVLDFWATWCAPCVRTFPSLMKLARDYPKDVVVIALSSDRQAQAVTSFLAKQSTETRKYAENTNVIIAVDTGLRITKDLYFTEKYPETIVISPEQRMVRKLIGETDWQSAEVAGWLEGAVKKSLK